ncbi:MAG TPA: hypothetical protein VIV56_09510 [Gemmatimonadales bacterium]
MRTPFVGLLSTAAPLALAAALRAQSAPAAAPATPPPPVRQIGAVTAVSHDSLLAVTSAVEIAGGRVYVNDILGHRVLLYDSTLSHPVVAADSDASSPNAYGSRPGTLIPFRGDSALFITPASLSMLVLDPAGRVARVMAMPPAGNGLPALLGSIFGTPGFDARGRLVYFAPMRMNFQRRGVPGAEGGGPITLQPPDSAFVVRFDLASRTLDTAAAIHIPRNRTTVTRDDRGAMHASLTALPPATVDDWAVTSDGRLAIVRGLDYHVDWLDAAGAWSATGRLPFPWERLTDEAKAALIDSVAVAMQTAMDSMAARMARGEGPGANGQVRVGAGSGAVPAGGTGGGSVMIFAAPGGDGPGGGAGGPPRTMQMSAPTVVKASPADVPDYRPAFGQGAVRADREGNLWIRTSTVIDGRPVYDVVNARGELVDRVQLPAFRTIAGFGPGVVYLGVRDEAGNMHLERARMR